MFFILTDARAKPKTALQRPLFVGCKLVCKPSHYPEFVILSAAKDLLLPYS